MIVWLKCIGYKKCAITENHKFLKEHIVAESQNIEYKESWRDEYLKWICGFANARGGCIYIGVRDDGKIVGIPDSKKLLEDIPNKIKDTMGILADVNLLERDGLDYIEIIVNPSTYPVSYHGEYHYRSGSTKQQLRGSALTEFLVRKTGYRWDAVPVDSVAVSDLDIESFEIFRKETVRTERMTKKDVECSNEELLEKLGLITDGKLKRAAVLLFYRNPQRLFTGCYVKIGRFGIGSDLQYQDVVEGSLILIADRVVDLIYLKYLKAKITYENDVRVETYPFAREAVREAVYNALIHCKWEDGIPIQIRIEDKNMYISNACVFPNDWTTENLMRIHNSRPYNPDLAGTFYRAGYIEAWGRGIQKICEACEELGAPMPEYILIGDDLTVKLSAFESAAISEPKTPKRQNGGLNGGLADRIIMVILSNKAVTIAEISDILTIPKRTVEREIKYLRESGRITRKGGRRYGYWEIM